MAVEAERVGGLAEWEVQIGRVFIDQKSAVSAAVDLMAFNAAALRHRPVQTLASLQQLLHVRELTAIGHRDGLIVTLKAELGRLLAQERGVIACVRVVTVDAGSLGRHRGVLRGGRIHRVGNVLVALRAQLH